MLKSASMLGQESLNEIMNRFASHDLSDTPFNKDVSSLSGKSEELDQLLGLYVKAAAPLYIIGNGVAGSEDAMDPEFGQLLHRIAYQAFGTIEQFNEGRLSLNDAVFTLRGFVNGGITGLFNDCLNCINESEHEEMFAAMWKDLEISEDGPFSQYKSAK